MPILNLGIVAHVDAGKTTLTERLLYETGVSTHLGRVDHGDTVTDADDLERRRGITIRSAVVTFTLGDTKVNLIDTPGHSDFVAEVERALSVLDGAVLVVSAVEGVQAQTRVLIRILERLRIPFLVFVNKIDRVGASYDATMSALRACLVGDAVAINEPAELGSRAAFVKARADAAFVDEVAVRMAEYDDDVLAAYLDDTAELTADDVLDALVRVTATGHVHPVVFGSALVGIGTQELARAVECYLPAATGRAEDPLQASVFKIERGPAGHKVAVARLTSGTLAARDHVRYFHRSETGVVVEQQGRVTGLRTYDEGAATIVGDARAGDIALIAGLPELEIGDQLGGWDPSRVGHSFAPPGLEAVVVARSPAQRPALFEALRRLDEQDPLIDAHLDGLDQELTVSLYGEVQREVIAARLAEEYGVDVEILPTRTVYIERVSGVGSAVRIIGTAGNPELATVGIRIQPGPVDSGIVYEREVQLGGLLLSFHTAIEETVPTTLLRGLYGWRVTDCIVTLTHSGYWAPLSAAGDFRRLTARVLREALSDAGTIVCAPVSAFEVELPEWAISAVLHKLRDVGATPEPPEVRAGRCRIVGVLPTDHVAVLEQRLPGLTQGEGFLIARPGGYEPVLGTPPTRAARATTTA